MTKPDYHENGNRRSYVGPCGHHHAAYKHIWLDGRWAYVGFESFPTIAEAEKHRDEWLEDAVDHQFAPMFDYENSDICKIAPEHVGLHHTRPTFHEAKEELCKELQEHITACQKVLDQITPCKTWEEYKQSPQ